MEEKHPLQAYLYRNKERVQYLCDALGVSEGTLRQLPYKTRLTPLRALAMEVATGGAVPVESVCDQGELCLELAYQILTSRAQRRVSNWHAEDGDQAELQMHG